MIDLKPQTRAEKLVTAFIILEWILLAVYVLVKQYPVVGW